MLAGGYGIKIHEKFLPEVNKKATEIGTTVYLEELPLSPNHIAVSCEFPCGSEERREFDNFLRLMIVKEISPQA